MATTKKTSENKAKSKTSKKGKSNKSNLPKYFGVFLFIASIFLFVSCLSYLFTWELDQDNLSRPLGEYIGDDTVQSHNILGKFGTFISHQIIYNGFGLASLLLSIPFLIFSLKLIMNSWLLKPVPTLKRLSFAIVWISILLGLIFTEQNLWLPGVFGVHVSSFLKSLFGVTGTIIILVFSLGLFLNISFEIKYNWIINLFKFSHAGNEKPVNTNSPETNSDSLLKEDTKILDSTKKILDHTDKTIDFDKEQQEKKQVEGSGKQSNNQRYSDELEINIPEESPDDKAPAVKPEKENVSLEVSENKEENSKPLSKGPMDIDPYDPTLDLGTFKMPDLSLLEDYGNSSINVDRTELESNKNKIVSTLNDYKIEISKIKATVGPTVTLYEIVPAPGVRISKIKNLEDDIALSLAALGIRIIAPIPGRGTIGIEVPNQSSEIVGMKSILGSSKFIDNKMELPIGLGKTISNETYVADLAKMPHLLMAGATGQGKSVGLNAILVSLLYKKHPSQIKFVLVDPKKVELTLFNKLERHYLAKLPDTAEAIITDTKKVVATLNSLCMEMDQRYELLKKAMVRNIKEYNVKFIARKLNPENGHKYLPYIVLVIDEFADLIMTAGKEVETPIARLAQLARAIGIHLIIATQRPSVNIITGIIKANFPSRIAFRVTSKVDSRTILDSGGADQLIGKGDMLMSLGSDLIRLQCAFVDTPEVEDICNFIGEQRGYPDAFLLPEFVDDSSGGNPNAELEDRDDLFEDAARIVVSTQQGSASMLQRKLKLGYNRAGRLVDQLEAAGIVGPSEGSKARQVLYPDEYTLEQYLNELSNNSN